MGGGGRPKAQKKDIKTWACTCSMTCIQGMAGMLACRLPRHGEVWKSWFSSVHAAANLNYVLVQDVQQRCFVQTILRTVDLMSMSTASNAYAAPTCKKHYTTVTAYVLSNESDVQQRCLTDTCCKQFA